MNRFKLEALWEAITVVLLIIAFAMALYGIAIGLDRKKADMVNEEVGL